MFKKCKVVMLPTNEKANALWWSGHKLYVKGPEDSSRGELNHLYFLSDEEEIKEGDWMYNPDREPSILQCIGKGSVRDWKKIIATTDKLIIGDDKGKSLLGTDLNNYLPQPSQSFIEKFVEEYNKGNVITEVMVEYIDEGEEGWLGDDVTGEPVWNEKIVLKVNPKDNTITICKVKDSLNRAELDPILELIREIATDDLDRVSGGIKNKAIERLKWIEENL